MKTIITKDYGEMSEKAALVFKELLKKKEDAVLGLATGSSPIGLYNKLIEYYEKGEISFRNVRIYNLDEYCGLPRSHPESYYSFMFRNLFSRIDIKKENIHLPGMNSDGSFDKQCEAYNKLLENAEIDLQLLGIGANGHIGFNEPGTPFTSKTHLVKLTEQTRNDNKRFFPSLDEVPTHAVTMGIADIMKAKRILLIASGKNKAEAIRRLTSGEVSADCPATFLNRHPDVIVIVDKEAASLICGRL